MCGAMKTTRTLAILVVSLLLSPVATWAAVDQMFDEYGVSPRDTAMGNAFAALADDYSATYYNPAGLVFIDGSHASLGYRGVYPVTHIRFSRGEKRNLGESPPSDFFLMGISSDLSFRRIVSPTISERFGLGLALAFSQYMKSFTIYADPNTPYLFRYADRPVSLMSVYFGGALRVFDWFSFGATMCLAPSVTYTDVIAHTNVYVPSFRTETTQTSTTRSWTKVDPVFGTLFRIPGFGRPDFINLAVVWRDEVLTLDGSGEVATINRIVFEETGQSFQAPSTIYKLHQLSGYAPMQFVLAASWNMTPAVHLTTDVIWKRWSMWLEGSEEKPNPPFHDTVQLRLGYEQQTRIDWAWIRDLIVRGGYYYDPSPTPSMNGPLNILDPDKHVGSVGLGFRFTDPLDIVLTPIQFDMAYQLHYLVEEHVENNNDPVYPELTAGGQVHNFAVRLDFAF